MKPSQPNYVSLALYRMSMLAFALCIFSFVALALMGLALSQQQPTLVAVDDRGRVHGYIEYLNPDLRSDEEINLAITQFVGAYLSVNSHTIVKDMQLALTMMSGDMAEQEKQSLIQSNRIATIQKSRLQGHVIIEEILLDRGSGNALSASVSGNIEAINAKRPFSVLIHARIVPRTIRNTLGLRIDAIQDRR